MTAWSEHIDALVEMTLNIKYYLRYE